MPPAEQLNTAMALKSEIIIPGNEAATWKRAMGKVKLLQDDWRSAGPAPARVDSALWRRFRAGLDQFYAIARERRSRRPGA